MKKILLIESRLYLREPLALFFPLVLPLGLMLGLGSLESWHEARPDLGGLRLIDIYAPMFTMLAVVTLGFSVLPSALTQHRTTGVLRRMSTTPVHPSRLLAANLIINLVLAAAGTALMMLFAHFVHQVPIPRQLPMFVLAFVLGCASLFAVGLVVAAVSPTSTAAGGIGSALMFPLMFFGGLWMPREAMPEVLQRIGDFLPVAPFGQALRDTWAGAGPQTLHLVVMAATMVLAGALAVRLFRWE